MKVVCVGIYEEFVARGYLLRNIADASNMTTAVIISSLVFALLHLPNDNASTLSTVGLFINALFFAAALLTTGRLSAAIGAHISWNLFEGAVLGFPVSGDKKALRSSAFVSSDVRSSLVARSVQRRVWPASSHRCSGSRCFS